MQNDWRADSILTMRKELIAQILSLSEDWRQRKAAQGGKRQQAPQEEEGDDSDVAIVEHMITLFSLSSRFYLGLFSLCLV